MKFFGLFFSCVAANAKVELTPATVGQTELAFTFPVKATGGAVLNSFIALKVTPGALKLTDAAAKPTATITVGDAETTTKIEPSLNGDLLKLLVTTTKVDTGVMVITVTGLSTTKAGPITFTDDDGVPSTAVDTFTALEFAVTAGDNGNGGGDQPPAKKLAPCEAAPAKAAAGGCTCTANGTEYTCKAEKVCKTEGTDEATACIARASNGSLLLLAAFFLSMN